MRLTFIFVLLMVPSFCLASSLMEENWERHLGVTHAPLLACTSDSSQGWSNDGASHSPSSVTKKKEDRQPEKNHVQRIMPKKDQGKIVRRDPQGFIYSK